MIRAGSLALVVALAASACSDSSGNPLFVGDPDAGEGGSAGGDSAAPGDGGEHTDGSVSDDDGGPDGGTTCASGPDDDADGDGFTPSQGDCNDCDPRMNPGAYDYPGNGIDENCSGVADDETAACDVGLSITGDNPEDAARALGICRKASVGSWGLLSAKWVLADGTTTSKGPSGAFPSCTAPTVVPNPDQRGILSKFGARTTPQQGSSMLALSSGKARDSAGGAAADRNFDGCTSSAMPQGFPRKSPMCTTQAEPTDKRAFDPIALELSLRVPTNARSFAFDLNVFTSDFPDYVCREFNDYFAALLWSNASGLPADRNLAIDAQTGTMGPNTPLLRVCTKVTAGGIEFPCPLGPDALQGTGYEGKAATGWLRATSPVLPGETIVLRFAIWDSFDALFDTTVLLDRFQWSEGSAKAVTLPAP